MPATLALSSKARGVSPALAAGAIACVVALLAALAGFSWAGWRELPVSVRFLVGLVTFGVAPGLLVVGALLSRSPRSPAASDTLISIITCSFSANLALNVVLFALHWSLTQLTHAYVLLLLGGYAGWAAWAAWEWRRHGTTPPQQPPKGASARGLIMVAGWGVLWAAASVVIYAIYLQGAPITNSEELVWLRKLVENPSVRYDNVSYRLGDPSTYLFVPFQIFIGGVSVIARMDLSLTYSLFWAVTTALSLLIISRLAFVIFGEPQVAALILLWMVAIAAFDPDSMIYGAGIIVPFPNRYGFAGGVLLPLILLLFWSLLREPRFQVWSWLLLVYVAIEMTFVHARETLLGVGVMSVAFLIMAWRPARHRRDLIRIVAVLALIGSVLVAYKRVNLWLAPDLDAYVAATTAACKMALLQLLSDHGPLDLFTVPVPRFMNVSVGGSTPVTLGFSTYQGMFLDPWNEKFLGRLYLPLALALLPVYILTARSIAALSLAVAFAMLALVTSSAFLSLLVSALVGTPEILLIYNVVAVLSALIVCALIWQFSAALARWCDSRPTFTLSVRSTSESGRARTGRIVIRMAQALVSASAMMVMWSVFSVDRLVEWRGILYGWLNGPRGSWLLVAIVVAIIYRVRGSALPVFAAAVPPVRGAMFTACCLIAVILVPAITQSTTWSRNPLAPAYPTHRFTGDLYRDYAMLVAPESKKLDPSPYPIDVIRYLREEVPPNRTLLASDAIGLLERVPHFAAILSNRGEVGPQYIVNGAYLRDYARSGQVYGLAPFLADDQAIESLLKMLAEYRIELIVVDPEESAVMKAAHARAPALSRRLHLQYDVDGWLIFGVSTPRHAGSSSE